MPWAGFPNTNGTPNSPTGSWVNYSNNADRIYAREWTATEDGTLTHINMRMADISITFSSNGAYGVVYNNGTKVAQIDQESTTRDTWTGELSLTVVSGESLDFSTNDVLTFGYAWDGAGGGGSSGLRSDNGSSNSNKYASVTVGSSGPPSSVSFSTSGTYDGLAVIIRYSVGEDEEGIIIPKVAHYRRQMECN